MEKLSVKVLGLSLGFLISISYVICTLWDLALPIYAMHVVWEPLLPGFVWLSAGSFLLGLIETFLYGIFIAVIFAPIYNYLDEKLK